MNDYPSRARYIVLAFLCSLAFILYLDRICISKAAPSITRELQLSEKQMGWVFSAFTLAYGLFEIPTGHWADRVGSRRVLTRISVWWSVFTAITGACGSLSSLLIVRFLFGAGEAGAYPNAARVIARWFPVAERGRAQGLLQFCALTGGAIAPVVAAYLISSFGWRWTFAIFGSVGVFWAVAFFAWFRDSPAEHARVNPAELALIGGQASSERHVESIPWKAVFRSRGILVLGSIMTFVSCNSYVYFSWLPSYLEKGRQVAPHWAGWLSTFVLAGGAIGAISGGWVTNRIMRVSINPVRGRQRWGSFACTVAAVLLVLGVLTESANLTTALLALSCLVMQATISNWWSSAIEISGRHIGAMFGLMNGMGVVGAMGSQLFFGYFVDWRRAHGYVGRDQWDPGFFLVAGVLLAAAIAWQFVDTSRSFDDDSDAKTKTRHAGAFPQDES